MPSGHDYGFVQARAPGDGRVHIATEERMARILVVEDEPLIGLMVEEWLKEAGHQTVGPAGSVESALALIDSSAIDAAILDVILGNEDCYEVAQSLRTRGIPFAFATGHSAEAIQPDFRDAPTLGKPYDFTSVMGVVGLLLPAST